MVSKTTSRVLPLLLHDAVSVRECCSHTGRSGRQEIQVQRALLWWREGRTLAATGLLL
jgi:hypothetical protein